MKGAGDTGAPENPTPPERQIHAEWLQLLQLTADTGSDLGHLLELELRLALANLGRMLMLALAFLPLLLFAWLGLTLLPAVLLYQYSGLPALGVLLFLAIQLLALGGVCAAWLRYRKALGLPRTRRQWRAFVGEGGGEQEVPES